MTLSYSTVTILEVTFSPYNRTDFDLRDKKETSFKTVTNQRQYLSLFGKTIVLLHSIQFTSLMLYILYYSTLEQTKDFAWYSSPEGCSTLLSKDTATWCVHSSAFVLQPGAEGMESTNKHSVLQSCVPPVIMNIGLSTEVTRRLILPNKI